jgi:hypothetical protein
LGGAVGDVAGAVGLHQASTYLGGTGGCRHHHFQHLHHLVRAGQSPRPCSGGELAVICGGLGWLLQLTQGRSLCIPASPRLALAHPGPGAAIWQGLLTNSHPHDLNVLPAGSLDPCREGASTWHIGEALEACRRPADASLTLPTFSLHSTVLLQMVPPSTSAFQTH